jgi:hypothetical protein
MNAKNAKEEYSALNFNNLETIRGNIDLISNPFHAVEQGINNSGTELQKKLFAARDYISSSYNDEFKSKYSALAAVYVDEHLTISYAPLNELFSNVLTASDNYTKTKRKVVGIASTNLLHKSGASLSDLVAIQAPKDAVSEMNVLSSELIRQLSFLDQITNNIDASNVESKYALISVEFKSDVPFYRIEGTVSTTPFKDFNDAYVKRYSKKG